MRQEFRERTRDHNKRVIKRTEGVLVFVCGWCKKERPVCHQSPSRKERCVYCTGGD